MIQTEEIKKIENMSYLLEDKEIISYFMSFQKGESILQKFDKHFKNIDINSFDKKKRKFIGDLCLLFTKHDDYSNNINQNLSVMYI